ncbi:MAG: LmbE-like protein [Frankiales bacterium]|nr:LmbE-like protein [Frankiales bacterium]
MTGLAPAAVAAVARRSSRVRDAGFRTSLRLDRGGPVLLLSPHLDDAVLSCWSVLSSTAELRVVNVFAGLPPPGRCTTWDSIAGATDSAALMEARHLEDAAALGVLGLRPENLSFLEHPHRRFGLDVSLRRLDAAISDTTPRVSHVLAPLALGPARHPDHLLLRKYALASSHLLPTTFYADVPYAVVYGWPAWVTGTPPQPHLDVDAVWRPCLSGVPGLAPARIVELDGPQAAQKLQTMRVYETQFATLDRGPIGQMSNPRIHGFEVYWDWGPT